jgi:Cellulase (glycosyl hydrolase family 5)
MNLVENQSNWGKVVFIAAGFLAIWVCVLAANPAQAQTPVPNTYFGVSVFYASKSLPLIGGIVPGTWGKIGYIDPGSIEKSCDGGTNQNSACYNWTIIDPWVAYAQANGLTLVYDWYVPGWQCGSSARSCSVLPSNMAYMTNLVTALVTRYKGKIHYYETGNELNTSSAWTGTCADLVLLNNTIYSTIKAVDPNAIVGAPNAAYQNSTSTCNSPTAVPTGQAWIWLQNFLQTKDSNGNYPTVDTAGYHIYGNSLASMTSIMLNGYKGFRSVMNAAGISKSMPLLVTEGSWGKSNPSSLSASDQAAFVARFLLMGASTWADGGGMLVNWYAYDLTYGTLNGNSGMNSQNASAYGQMENWVKGAVFSGQCATGSPSTLYVCNFTNASGKPGEIIFNNNAGASASYTAPPQYTAYQPLLGTAKPISGSLSVANTPILLLSAASTSVSAAP